MDSAEIGNVAQALAREAEVLVVVVIPSEKGTERLMYSGVKCKGKDSAGIAMRVLARLIGVPQVAAEEFVRGLSGCTAEQLLATAIIHNLTIKSEVDRRTWYTPGGDTGQ